MRAYKLEVRFTIIMTILLIIAGNLGLVFSMFPVEGYLFGYPIMYIVPILVGWFGVLFLTYVASVIGNKVDDIIDEESGEGEELEVEDINKPKTKEGA